ncbi:hypothetical protein D3879_02255 [Pseudomonas cavernicola]|uniref:Uncharacterized protein n=1 Tax=Pseudomonas cavernicola TaxID=2320866 RepID=A0A418XI98_9PSED|nr:hypothetical protein D3879_02255 [Pseudomonas cavernicola]
MKTCERRSGKAKTGEEAELTAVNEHSEPVFNAASPMRSSFHAAFIQRADILLPPGRNRISR